MNILITGASGFLGHNLTLSLLANGHNLRLLTRNKQNIAPSIAASPQVEVIEADLNQPETLKEQLEHIEIVYHLAGILGQADIPDEVYWEINYKSTKNLLDLCAKTGNIKRFIHCSSAGVQGPIFNPPADESYPYAPSNIYETTKAEAEKLVLNSGLPVVVIRPEFVYGPGDLHVLGLFQAVAKGRFVLFGGGLSFLHPTYIDDAVQGLKLALTSERAIGQVYIIAAERAVTVAEMANQIADTLGVQRPHSIPLWFGKLAANGCDFITDVTDIQLPLNKARFIFFTQHRSFNISKAKRELGYQPKFDLAAGIKATINWYKNEGYL